MAKDSLGKIVIGNYLSDDEEWKFNFESNSYEKSNHTYEFDKNGNQITKITYHSPKYPLETTRYSYLAGLITEYNRTMVFSDVTIKIKELCKYDNLKNLVSLTTYRDDEYLRKEIYKYDLKGHIIEKNEIDEEGTIKDKVFSRYDNDLLVYQIRQSESYNNEKQCKYDSIGKLIYESNKWGKDKSSDQEVFFETTYEYTDKLISSENRLRNGEKIALINYSYSDGKLSKSTEKYSSRTIEKEYKYYPDKRSEVFIAEEGKQTIEEYDKYNNLIRIQTISKDGKTEEFTYQYTYDLNSNWTKIVEFRNTIPLKIRLRNIKYY